MMPDGIGGTWFAWSDTRGTASDIYAVLARSDGAAFPTNGQAVVAAAGAQAGVKAMRS
jgi:hypothetical protein